MRVTLFSALGVMGLFSFGVARAQSADAIQVAGKTYEELEFIGTNGEVATFYSKQGPVTAKWLDLPANVRQRFARAYAEAFEREAAAAQAVITAPIAISGVVLQKLKHHILVQWNDRRVILTGYPNMEDLEVGENIAVVARRSGQMKYQDLEGKTAVTRAFVVQDVGKKEP